MYSNDNRVVLTLDAGGTNLVFSAMQSNREVIEPISLPTATDNLEACLESIKDGFAKTAEKVGEKPVAISFAFPGPADYTNGIIGDLPNFPSFRGGVALGAYLEDAFNIPVFINNDGSLYAYGEAIGGFLPEINTKLKESGSKRRYENLLGFTFGTGFGCGMAIGGKLFKGDNDCSGEIWRTHGVVDHDIIAEEGVSIRSVVRTYVRLSGETSAMTPKNIFDIAEGTKPGDSDAAINAFARFGKCAGYSIATAVNFMDAPVVIGGGLSKAHKYFMPSLIEQLNATIKMADGTTVRRVAAEIFDLTSSQGVEGFLKDRAVDVPVMGSDRFVSYDAHKSVGVAISTIGASEAISIGAYSYALSMIDR